MHGHGMGRWWAFGGVILAVLAVGLDVTVLSVALPTLAGELDASESQLQWFSSGYALVLAAAILPAGLLGDRYGRRRVMAGALVLFGAGSVACAYAPSAEAFIAARLLLGLAGAALIVMALSIITALFSEEERPRAVGIWAAANFLAFPVGPILGGWMLTSFWWGWVFLINVPVALLGLVALLALVPESRAAVRPAIDGVAVALSSVGLAVITYGLIEAGQNGWVATSAIVPLVGGVAAIAVFAGWESWLGRRAGSQPLVDLRLFRSPAFTWGVVLSAVGMMALVGILFTMPQFFQAIGGADAQGSGVRLLPVIVGLVAGAVPADRLVNWVGPKIAVGGGFLVAAGGFLVGASTTAGSDDTFTLAWTFLSGMGLGVVLATAASAAIVQLPADQAGVGAGLLQSLNRLGAPFGSAIFGSVLSSSYQGQVQIAGLSADAATAVKASVFGGLAVAQQTGLPQLADSVRAAFVVGLDDALRVAVGIAIAAVALALLGLPARMRGPRSQPS